MRGARVYEPEDFERGHRAGGLRRNLPLEQLITERATAGRPQGRLRARWKPAANVMKILLEV